MPKSDTAKKIHPIGFSGLRADKSAPTLDELSRKTVNPTVFEKSASPEGGDTKPMVITTTSPASESPHTSHAMREVTEVFMRVFQV